jgi:transketolase
MNAHDFQDIVSKLEEAKEIHEKPTVIIAYTTPGKGVDFMENNYKWHGVPPNKEQAAEALRQLKIIEEKIISEI